MTKLKDTGRSPNVVRKFDHRRASRRTGKKGTYMNVDGRPAFFEEIVVGHSCDLGTIAMEQNEMISFATAYDPQTFHVDPVAASNLMTKGLIASGWYTVARAMRLLATSRPFGIEPILGIGVDELRWPTPARPGDFLCGVATVSEVRSSANKPERGVVKLTVEFRNQRDEVALVMKPSMVVPRRAHAPGRADVPTNFGRHARE